MEDKSKTFSIMKQINTLSTILAIFLITTLCSCTDSKIARKLEGTWTASYISPNEDGTKWDTEEMISFVYDDKESSGGSFIDIRTYHTNAELDDYFLKCNYICKIKGSWGIAFGDLYLSYDLSSLEIEIGEDDIELQHKLLPSAIKSIKGTILYSSIIQEIIKEIKPELYKESFQYYQSFTEECSALGDVRIDGNSFSVKTADIGRITFHRVNE